LSTWSLPLVRRGGLFLAMKGSSAPDELTSAASIIGRLGGSGARIESVGAEWLTPPVTVVRVEKTGDMR
ncbi:MAG: gidB, partial [Marmoricola sp.]|nr:gidB [Marmoricola sp.]